MAHAIDVHVILMTFTSNQQHTFCRSRGESDMNGLSAVMNKFKVDYAHTPDALDNAIAALQSEESPVTLVFGCGGDRDRSKRAAMADAASAADQVFVTDDNPRTENPEQIFDDIRQSQYAAEFEYIHDRTQAIHAALVATPAEGVH